MHTKIIRSGHHSFRLWLEFEEVEGWQDLKNDFANVIVNMLDGRRYGINVWTFQFLETAVKLNIEKGESGKGTWIIPPDLFVKELTRECLEATLLDLLSEGELEEALSGADFGLNYPPPWIDWLDIEDTTEIEKDLFGKMGPLPRCYGKRLSLLANNRSTGEWAVHIAYEEVAVVPYPKEKIVEEDLLFFKNKKDFWLRKLRFEI